MAYSNPTSEVLALAQINFEGNITPRTWKKHLAYPDGKVHFPAKEILSEIVYWYRPVTKERNGQVFYEKKFRGDRLQKSYAELCNSTGLTRQQVRDGCEFLKEKGLITLHVEKTVITDLGKKLGNVLYIGICPAEIKRITFEGVAVVEAEENQGFQDPCVLQTNRYGSTDHELVVSRPEATVLQTVTNTKITAENSPKNSQAVNLYSSRIDASSEPLADPALAALCGDGTAGSLPNGVVESTHVFTTTGQVLQSSEESHPPKSPFPKTEVVTTLADNLIDRATAACKKTKTRLSGYQRQAIRTYPELAKNAVADLESELKSGSVDNAAQCLGGLLKVYLGEKMNEFVKPKPEGDAGKAKKKGGKKRVESEPEQDEWVGVLPPVGQPLPDRRQSKLLQPDTPIQLEDGWTATYRTIAQPEQGCQDLSQKDPRLENPTQWEWIPEKGENVVTVEGVRFEVKARSRGDRRDDGYIPVFLYADPNGNGTRYRLEDCRPLNLA